MHPEFHVTKTGLTGLLRNLEVNIDSNSKLTRKFFTTYANSHLSHAGL